MTYLSKETDSISESIGEEFNILYHLYFFLNIYLQELYSYLSKNG